MYRNHRLLCGRFSPLVFPLFTTADGGTTGSGSAGLSVARCTGLKHRADCRRPRTCDPRGSDWTWGEARTVTQGPSGLPFPLTHSQGNKPSSWSMSNTGWWGENLQDSCRCLWWVQFLIWWGWRTQCRGWRQSLGTLSGLLSTSYRGSQSTRGPERNAPTFRSKPPSASSLYLLLPTCKLSFPGFLECLLLLSRSVVSDSFQLQA